MQPRMDPYKTAPKAIEAMLSLETYVQNAGLEHSLVELVKTRASQSMAAPIAFICTQPMPGLRERPKWRLYLLDACENRLSTARAKERRWHGRKR